MTKHPAQKIAKEIAQYIRQHGYSTTSALTAVYLHNGISWGTWPIKQMFHDARS